MDKHRIVEPFLYIDQPFIKKPSARMQERYHSKEMEEMQELKHSDNHRNKKETAFKQLSVQEKIDYFLDLPGEMPRLRCEIHTDEDRFRGIIISQDSSTILLRMFGLENEKINKAEIQNIRLLGF